MRAVQRFLHKVGDGMPLYNPQLETFLQVVEAGSFNKAADNIHIGILHAPLKSCAGIDSHSSFLMSAEYQ